MQKTCQRAMTKAIRSNNFRSYHRSIFHLINLELLRMAKMLKDLSIFIGYRNFHSVRPP